MNRRQNRPSSNVLTLHKEIRNRTLARKVNICLVGDSGTGKSTLSKRFGNMDQGPYDDSIVIRQRNKYIIPINLDNRPNVHKNGFIVLHVYIEPPPHLLRWPPLCVHAQLFSLFVLCFDVNDIDTFTRIPAYLRIFFKYLKQNLPPCILLGNKIDLRDDPDRVVSNAVVSTKLAKRKTKKWKKVTCYFECSAWENRGVDTLLDFILNFIL